MPFQILPEVKYGGKTAPLVGIVVLCIEPPRRNDAVGSILNLEAHVYTSEVLRNLRLCHTPKICDAPFRNDLECLDSGFLTTLLTEHVRGQAT
jgi:hypothetical protein